MTFSLKIFFPLLIILFLNACEGGKTSSVSPDEIIASPNADEVTTAIEQNHIPIANEQRLETDEDSNLTIVLKAEDDDNDTLTFFVATYPIYGQLVGEAPTLTYQPNSNYNGEESFTFFVQDGTSTSKEATVTIQVTPVNDTPIALKQELTVANDGFKTIQLLGEDSDDENFSYTITQPPSYGQLSGIPPNITYVPEINYIGEDFFTFAVSDGKEVSDTQKITITVTEALPDEVNISGRVTYDRVPPKSNREGLDYDNVVAKTVKYAMVEILSKDNTVLQKSVTDENGSYLLTNIPAETDVKIRVYAKMVRTGSPSWNVKVIDNTQNNALFGIEGTLTSSGTHNSVRNLHAASGWNGNTYSDSRAAAPFAIMDTVYTSMQNILNADSGTSFPQLIVNWSVNNKPVEGLISNGDIVTSHYNNGNLYILGDDNTDTDEYDTYVIAHEWGHYYEDKFSRTDSLGGAHGEADILDIRVAFGEGFGNAIAAMAHNDPLYYDTYGAGQAQGWSMDIESGAKVNPGWYSESSVQRILYDLYDERTDTHDNLALGFKPMHEVFVGAQKTTEAFTSLFSFITALKKENNTSSEAIDEIVSQEEINTIDDIYGTNRTLLSAHYPYSTLIVGTALENICTTNTYGYLGSRNKLSNHKYIAFSIPSSGNYRIRASQTNGTGSDPDFMLYQTSPFTLREYVESPFDDVEQVSGTLSKGDYLLDITDWNSMENACYEIRVDAI